MKLILRALVATCFLAACSPADAPTTGTEVAATSEESSMLSGPRPINHAIPDRDFRITVTNNPTEGSFDLHLTSLNGERELCVGAAEWPDDRGRLESAADSTFLQANGEGYSMRDRGEEECGEACVRRIAPGASLDGFISYSQFPPEAFDPPGPATLTFQAQPYFCDSGEVE